MEANIISCPVTQGNISTPFLLLKPPFHGGLEEHNPLGPAIGERGALRMSVEKGSREKQAPDRPPDGYGTLI